VGWELAERWATELVETEHGLCRAVGGSQR
jgi:hypothetical protein